MEQPCVVRVKGRKYRRLLIPFGGYIREANGLPYLHGNDKRGYFLPTGVSAKHIGEYVDVYLAPINNSLVDEPNQFDVIEGQVPEGVVALESALQLEEELEEAINRYLTALVGIAAQTLMWAVFATFAFLLKKYITWEALKVILVLAPLFMATHSLYRLFKLDKISMGKKNDSFLIVGDDGSCYFPGLGCVCKVGDLDGYLL